MRDSAAVSEIPGSHRRLRVGYLSADFREHAVAYLMTGVFESHDKTQYEVIALSLKPQDTSHYGQRIVQAVDQFVDLSTLSDPQATARIRSLGIDVLIDLVGHTQGSRSNILAPHPAALQLNYLGYPGTMGVDYMDYIVADDYLIPEESQRYYSEKILYLPECFQANDNRRYLAAHTPSRTALGLPSDGMVLCCFNNSFKLTPAVFDIWMRLLQSITGSALWLVAHQPLTQQNLRHEATRRGVDSDRLVFAKQVPYEEHLARLGCADLFLDTLPFNGGTTVSDALWTGLPVLTCSGEAFASRMGGSLLHAAGLSELVCDDLEGYERVAGELLRDRSRLSTLRAHLNEQRQRSVLFDTPRFTRHLEQAYQLIHRRRLERQPASSVRVPRLPRDSEPTDPQRAAAGVPSPSRQEQRMD